MEMSHLYHKPMRIRERMQRDSEDRARGVWALLGMSCFGRRSNNVNGAEIMTDIFGHSNIFATHSLTHSLTHYTSLLTIKTLSGDICVGERWLFTACPAFVRHMR